jgi:hypothetical protein
VEEAWAVIGMTYAKKIRVGCFAPWHCRLCILVCVSPKKEIFIVKRLLSRVLQRLGAFPASSGRRIGKSHSLTRHAVEILDGSAFGPVLGGAP